MNDVIVAVDQYSPGSGYHLIITDDLDTALEQAKANPRPKTRVIMVDVQDSNDKARTYKGVRIVPRHGPHITDETAMIIRNW
jgi:hypothetical protein